LSATGCSEVGRTCPQPNIAKRRIFYDTGMATPVDDLLHQIQHQFNETQDERKPAVRVLKELVARKLRRHRNRPRDARASDADGAPSVNDLLHQIRHQFDEAQDAISSLVRVQIGQGLAATFLERSRPFQDDDRLAALVDRHLISESAFMQKAPALLRFYMRLLVGLKADRILEIGVKGGGSTALWKQLFPSATVVGLDIDLRPRLGGDGVTYVQGDQSDAAQLTALANTYGPFDLVIDDGSHESRHQTTSLRTLLGHVRAGGLYVIEDTHETLKPEKGEDIWPDFVTTFFQRMRGPKAVIPADSAGARLAIEMFPRMDDVILSAQAITIRVR
jgi:predicted O-methyltransferase YrrM